MTDCIGPAAHAFALAPIWIWPPGAEPVQPQEIHVNRNAQNEFCRQQRPSSAGGDGGPRTLGLGGARDDEVARARERYFNFRHPKTRAERPDLFYPGALF